MNPRNAPGELAGRQEAGSFAEHVVADARYCFQLPATIDDVHAAPLMCDGLIGYHSLRMAGDAKRLGIFGLGTAAHILAQVGPMSKPSRSSMRTLR